MSITINGTGTITGISAGGLPDGVITADDISASAITRPKMGYPGAVLQLVVGTIGGSFSTSSGSEVATGMKVVITPIRSNSQIVVIGNIGSFSSVAWASAGGGIYRNGTALAASGYGQYQQVANIYIPASICAVDSPGVTTAITYELYHRGGGGNSDVGLGRIFAMEVAA